MHCYKQKFQIVNSVFVFKHLENYRKEEEGEEQNKNWKQRSISEGIFVVYQTVNMFL